jgi:DNA-binding response OmpR family regulator
LVVLVVEKDFSAIPKAPLIQEALKNGGVALLASSESAARAWMGDVGSPAIETEKQKTVVVAGDLKVDLDRCELTWGSREIAASDQEMRLLHVLARDSPSVTTFETLSLEVWGYASYGGTGAARSAVKRLRKKLQQWGTDLHIEAVRGVGFRLRFPSLRRDN